MKKSEIVVHALWDEDAKVWSIRSDQIDGLAVEAASFEEIAGRVHDALSDLIEANGIEGVSPTEPEIPIHIMAEQLATLRNPCH